MVFQFSALRNSICKKFHIHLISLKISHQAKGFHSAHRPSLSAFPICPSPTITYSVHLQLRTADSAARRAASPPSGCRTSRACPRRSWPWLARAHTHTRTHTHALIRLVSTLNRALCFKRQGRRSPERRVRLIHKLQPPAKLLPLSLSS